MNKEKKRMNRPIEIELRELSRAFDGYMALERVTCSIPAGQIYGLLGPNGAGKTTLLKILAGLLTPTRGAARVCGLDVEEDRQKVLALVGSLIEVPVFYDHLSARVNLSIHLAYMGAEGDISAALAQVGLENMGEKPVGKLSLGMRQRLAMARAMVHRPRVLLLDEPLNGLDPIAIGEMRDLFRQLAAEGTTLVVSSHILSEVEQTAHRVGVLAGGRLVLEENMETLKTAHPQDLETFLVERMRGGVA